MINNYHFASNSNKLFVFWSSKKISSYLIFKNNELQNEKILKDERKTLALNSFA